MKRVSKITGYCAFTVLSAMAAPSNALTLDEIAQRDFDGDGKIESGPEVRALLDVDVDLTTFQEAVLLEAIETPGPTAIPIAAFDDRPYYDRLKARCEVKKRFFLQDSIASISLLDPALFSPSKKGAKFTLTDDRETGTTSWEVQGAMAWLPNSVKKCLRAGDTEVPDGAVLTGYAIAPVLTFSGKGTSGAADTSALRFGIMSQFQVFGGNTFSLQEFTVTPYYQTDFEGRAEIYGLEATWKPYQLKNVGFASTLNGIPENKPDQSWDISFLAKADFRTVKEAGLSGLADGQEYSWVGAVLGVGYTAPVGEHGTRLGLDVNAFTDLKSGTSATSYTVSATTFLSEDSRTSLALSYEKGRDYQKLEDKDTATLSLRLAF